MCLNRFRPGFCLHPGPRLRAAEHGDAKIAPHEKLLPFAAEREPAPVDKPGLRIENFAAAIFRAVLRDAAQDDEPDYGRVFPVSAALLTARRLFLRIEAGFDSTEESPVLFVDTDDSRGLFVLSSIVLHSPTGDGASVAARAPAMTAGNEHTSRQQQAITRLRAVKNITNCYHRRYTAVNGRQAEQF